MTIDNVIDGGVNKETRGGFDIYESKQKVSLFCNENLVTPAYNKLVVPMIFEDLDLGYWPLF